MHLKNSGIILLLSRDYNIKKGSGISEWQDPGLQSLVSYYLHLIFFLFQF